MAFAYPVSLEVSGRRCVVIGGDGEAEAKVTGLLEAGARVDAIAPSFTGGLEEMERRGEVSLLRRGYEPADLDGAFLAIAVTRDPEANGRIRADAEARRVLLNSVDDVANCHFAAPSVLRRGALTFAISTEGKAPALAKRLRLELTERYGDEYGVLVEALGQVRGELLAGRPAFPEWTRRWEQALERDLPALARAGRLDELRSWVAGVLQGAPLDDEDGPRPPGKVWIVGAGPGDPELITVRGKAALERADVVVHDRLVHPSLMEGKERIDVGKAGGRHVASQEDINELLVTLAREGREVVRLKGGDPFVFGRGAEEVDALAAAGVEHEVVPAPTSAVAVLGRVGIPVTDRRFASCVAVATGHCAAGREVDWRGLARSADTIVVLMGLGNLDRIAAELMAGGLTAATPAAVVANGTFDDERVIEATLGDIAGEARRLEVAPPAVVVVGDVVACRTASRAASWAGCGPGASSSRDRTA